MNKDKKFTTDDLKSGFVVELRSGERRLVTRAGGNNFTKILVNPYLDKWNYLSCWDRDKMTYHAMTRRGGKTFPIVEKGWDIMKVYGLVNCTTDYCMAFNPDALEHRDLLWQRSEPVKMTLKQIEEKLGHEILIVAEETDI